MADRAFVDANVLLRTLFEGMNDHEICQTTLSRLIEKDTELWISHQVIREFCVNATHENTFVKERAPRPHYDRVLDVVAGLPGQFSIAEEDVSVRREFLQLMRAFKISGKPIHDANIVATMLAHGIEKLVTRNSRHSRRYEDRGVKLIAPSQDPAL